MRKMRYWGLLALLALVCVAFSSCGYSQKSAEKMVERYESGDMTQEDYEKCITWVEQYTDEYVAELEEVLATAKNGKKFSKMAEDVDEKMDDKWADIDDVIEMLNEASYKDEKEMRRSNVKRWKKLNDSFDRRFSRIIEKASKKFGAD